MKRTLHLVKRKEIGRRQQQGDVALPRGCTGAETIHEVTRIDGKFVRAISWIVVCVGIESSMSALGRRAVLNKR